MTCPICSGSMEPCFTKKLLGKYKAQYEACKTCKFLRVHEPHWLDEAYSNPITTADTGLVMRNIALACQVAGALYWVLGERGEGRYLDAAGGFGILTRLMRDLGFDFYWTDKYCTNLIAPGFEYSQEMGGCNAVTAMEVLEHLTNPVTFIEETLAFSGTQNLLFTTELYKGPPPPPDSWWFYAFATGQHIGFFQERTLETLGAKVGLQFASANGLHIFSKNKINKNILYIVTARWAACLAPFWIRNRLGSKTMADHELMLKKTTNANHRL